MPDGRVTGILVALRVGATHDGAGEEVQSFVRTRPRSPWSGKNHMLSRSMTRWVLLVPLCLAMGSCSLLFVHSPPPGHQAMDSFSCAESKVLPRLDYAGAFLALGAAAIVSPTETVSESVFFGTVTTTSGSATNAALGFGGAVLLGVSGWVGGRRVEACRAAKLELAERNGAAASARSTAASARLPGRWSPALFPPGPDVPLADSGWP